ISVEPTAGGWGGTVGSDGESALINLCNGGFRNIPAEVYETKFPVRVEEFSLRRDSGGVGRWRGGCGVVRSYRLLDDCFGALWFERSKTPGWGLAGGSDGAGPSNEIIYPDGKTETPLKMRARRFPKGTLFVTRTGGGGGYGNPKARPVEEVRVDVVSGLVSAEEALANYGVAFNDDFSVDTVRTEARRSS
ncbi:hydantoinase B/oxoprolinase family protein, partial [Rhizobiaceae sp. 2RAB30]